ncbi:MAG: PAS domain-containing protein [Nitrospinae bacterium]|nr:PAS domain-containing protein [Nitrospinota bacterium]
MDKPKPGAMIPSTLFENALSSFTDAVILLGMDGNVQWMNSAAEQITGSSSTHAVGGPMAALFPANTPTNDAVTQAMETGLSVTDHDSVYVNRRMERLPVGVSVYPLAPEEGSKGAAVVIRDLTAFKAMERLAGAGERIEGLSTLAAGIAHEIKNPLGGIRGAAQLLRGEKGGARETAEYTGLIIREVDRINRLITDFIALNQPGDFPMEPLNLYPVLDDAISLLKPLMDQKDIRVLRVFDPSLPPVIGNGDRFRQIFLNIIKNAVEACENGGRVTVATSLAMSPPLSKVRGKKSRFALVEVADDGPGLDDETKWRLFTPFFSRKKQGSGLGLVMTLHLVQAHGGLLELDNRPHGPGAVASVYLPYAQD